MVGSRRFQVGDGEAAQDENHDGQQDQQKIVGSLDLVGIPKHQGGDPFTLRAMSVAARHPRSFLIFSAGAYRAFHHNIAERERKEDKILDYPAISRRKASKAASARSDLRWAFSRLSRIGGPGSSGTMPQLEFIGAKCFGSVSTR